MSDPCFYCGRVFKTNWVRKRHERLNCWKRKQHSPPVSPKHNPKDEMIQQLEKIQKNIQDLILDLTKLETDPPRLDVAENNYKSTEFTTFTAF